MSAERKHSSPVEVLGIEDMHCGSCALRVERALANVEGVSRVHVDLAAGRARVLGPALDRGALERAVTGAGYRVRTDSAAASDPGIERDREAVAWRSRAAGAAAGLVALLVLRSLLAERPARILAEAAIGSLVVVLAGLPFHRSALTRLRRGGANMDSLVSLGTSAALAAGLVSVLQGASGMTFLDGAMIVTFLATGRWWESRAKGRASRTLKGLLEMTPERALRFESGEFREVPVAALAPGDEVLVRPGDRVPVDAIVLEGESEVDESWFTGEALPVPKSAGTSLLAGTSNRRAALRVRVERSGADTSLARLVERVRDAQAGRAEVQRFADAVVGRLVPAVLAIAVATFLGWAVATADPWAALRPMVAVLVVACPCAMGLATPTAMVVAIGRAAERGVLVRDARDLERAATVTCVVLDKTGTLTSGRPEVRSVEAAAGVEEAELLRLAAAAERPSSHPLAIALVAEAERRGLSLPEPREHELHLGGGVTARVEGRRVVVGSPRFVAAQDVDLPASVLEDDLADRATTPCVVAADGRLLGTIHAEDAVPDSSAEAVRALHRAGIRTVLLSGDRPATVRHVAERVGIEASDAHARQSPIDKMEFVQALPRDHGGVAMVGDGVNDAAAMSVADLGIAVGAAADVAIDTAGLVVLHPGLEAVPEALSLARATRRVVRQNLGWALGYNALLIPLAAGVLEPFLGISLPPTAAAAAMALSSVSVLTNSLRLRRFGRNAERRPAASSRRGDQTPAMAR